MDNKNKKGADNHREIASHLEQAAKHHHDAAKHHEAGDADKAARSTVLAQGHHAHANDAMNEQVKSHAKNDDKTM